MTKTPTNWWLVLNTDVRVLLGLPPKPGTWRHVIADSGLRADVCALITQIIQRARLWRSESFDVAHELIAHFHDGLNAGRSADDLVKQFGDVKSAAKLIKRAKMRNRPFLWRVSRRCAQTTLGVAGVYILAICWFMLDKPKPDVDYLAVINKTADETPESDCAWPIYRKAWIEAWPRYNKKDYDRSSVYVDLASGNQRLARPSDSKWTNVTPYLEQNRNIIEAARLGAAKPHLGFHLRQDNAYSRDDCLALWGRDALLSANATEPMNRLLYGVLIPHVSLMAGMCRILSLDMTAAQATHDADRFVADYAALVGIAKQIREGEFLAVQYYAATIITSANLHLELALENQPDMFTRDQFVTLTHLVTTSAQACKVDLAAERIFDLDLIQRSYSDDGDGNGHMTREGLLYFQEISRIAAASDAGVGWAFERTTLNHDAYSYAALPIAVFTMASRREILDVVDKRLDKYESLASLPLWEVLARRDDFEIRLKDWESVPTNRYRFGLAFMMSPPVVDRIVTVDTAIAYAEAASLAIGLELYRRQHGKYPDDLAALVPQYFPHVPLDHSTGKPLLYKIRDSKPLLYGRGENGKDDGGETTSIEAIEFWTPLHVPMSGDWVLYPVPLAPAATQPTP